MIKLNTEGVRGRTHSANFPLAQTYNATKLLFLMPYFDNLNL
jgi:hypothetical protein